MNEAQKSIIIVKAAMRNPYEQGSHGKPLSGDALDMSQVEAVQINSLGLIGSSYKQGQAVYKKTEL